MSSHNSHQRGIVFCYSGCISLAILVIKVITVFPPMPRSLILDNKIVGWQSTGVSPSDSMFPPTISHLVTLV